MIIVEAPPDMPREELTDWLDDHIGRDSDEKLIIVFHFGRQDGPKLVARHRGQAPVNRNNKPRPGSKERIR
jgi:hypothetical protein